MCTEAVREHIYVPECGVWSVVVCVESYRERRILGAQADTHSIPRTPSQQNNKSTAPRKPTANSQQQMHSPTKRRPAAIVLGNEGRERWA